MAAQEKSMTKPPRIWISSTTPKKGDVLILQAFLCRFADAGPQRRRVFQPDNAGIGVVIFGKKLPGKVRLILKFFNVIKIIGSCLINAVIKPV